MNDSRLATLLRDLADDVPARTDDEAIAAFRRAVARRNRRRTAVRGLGVAAAAAVVAIVAWAVSPISDDDTPVASSDGTPAQPTFAVDVTADIAGLTGVLPPLVVVSAEGMTVTVIDPLSPNSVGKYEGTGLAEYATVTTSSPVSAAAIGPHGRSVFLAVPAGASSSVVQVDLASGEIVRRWHGAAGMETASDHERVAYLQPAGADGGQGVVVEHLDTGERKVFATPAAGPGIDGWLSWSSDGRLAVGDAAGTVQVLDPEAATSFDDATPVTGPLFNADWADHDILMGTSECCESSPVVVTDVSAGTTEPAGFEAVDFAAIDTGGSPWESFYIDGDGRLRTTGPDPDVDIGGVAQLEW